MIGKMLSFYHISEKLGEGGMGVVYKAEDTRLERTVAIKFLPRSMAAKRDDRDRFKREAKAAAALNHPNIATIHAIEELDDELFIVMEYIEGIELHELVRLHKAEPLPIEQILDYAIQIAHGLEAAHEKNIVHRDIKSSNIMLTPKGHIKIMDFGLAKILGDAQITQAGATLGTAAYMSPEQAFGDEVDHRTDIWSFGVVLYEMLTGRLPFRGDYIEAVFYAILHEEPEFLTVLRPDASPELERIVNTALTKDPNARYQGVAQMRLDLEAVKHGASAGEVAAKAQARVPVFIAKNEAVETQKQLCVGREQEFSRFEAFLADSLAGKGKVIFVTGEAGGGKSTLMKAFSTIAQLSHEDIIAVSGKCNASGGFGDPYLPFREVLGLLTGDVEALWHAGAITREHAMRLWNLVPDAVQALEETGPDLIDTMLPGNALISRAQLFTTSRREWLNRLKKLVENKTGAAPVNLQQIQLFGQYTKVLLALARQRPLLIMLDDLQWADAGSISLLFHLGRNIEGSRILIVGSYRPTQIVQRPTGERHPLEAVVNEFKQIFGDSAIELNQTNGRHFVDALIDTEPNRLGASFRDMLFRQTEGHPLFTVELLHSLQEKGFLLRDRDNRWVEGPTLDWNALPARVDAMVGERLGRLPEELKHLLTLASAQGETFTAEVMAKQKNMDPREMVQLLSADLDKRHNLVRAQEIQRKSGGRISQYRFRHVLFQRYLYNTLDEVEKTYLHEDVGLILEELYGDAKTEIAVQLARHFRKANIIDKALFYAIEAATQAKQVYANAEAIEHYQQALALIEANFKDKIDDPFYARATQILESLGDVQELSGRHDDARALFEKALSRVPQTDILGRARLHSKTASIFRVQRRFEEALPMFEAAEVTLETAAERTPAWWHQWIEVQNERTWHHYWLGQLEKMTEIADKAKTAVEQYGSPAQRAKFYNGLTLLAYRRDRYFITDETVHYSRLALTASEESQNNDAIGMSLFLLGFTLLWRGELAEAEQQLLASLQLVEKTGDIVLQSRCLTYLTITYRRQKRPDKVREFIPKSLAVAESGQMIEYIGMAKANAGWLAWFEGDLVEAEKQEKEAFDAWNKVPAGHASAVMQWTAIWPSICIALTKDDIPAAADLAARLLEKNQQRIPDELAALVEHIIQLKQANENQQAHARLQEAVDLAKRLLYL